MRDEAPWLIAASLLCLMLAAIAPMPIALLFGIFGLVYFLLAWEFDKQ